MFLSKSDSVKPIWYPLRLFSLIPFHTTRMALPTNDVADIHYSNKKNNLKPVIEPSDLACSYSQLKTLILVLIWSYWFKYFTIVRFFKKESMVMFMFFFFFLYFLGGGLVFWSRKENLPKPLDTPWCVNQCWAPSSTQSWKASQSFLCRRAEITETYKWG